MQFCHRAVTRLLVLNLILITIAARAQELGTAVLKGDITDPQGAVVTNARVIARNTATGVERSTVSTNAGLFAFNDLAPGVYEVRAEAKGFAPSVSKMGLQVGQQANATFWSWRYSRPAIRLLRILIPPRQTRW